MKVLNLETDRVSKMAHLCGCVKKRIAKQNAGLMLKITTQLW